MKAIVELKKNLTVQDALKAIEELLHTARETTGAIAVYIGIVKEVKPRKGRVEKLVVNTTEETREKLEEIVREETAKRRAHATVLLHNIGELKPRDPIMIVAAASESRNEALSTVKAVVDKVKTLKPFIKREEFTSDDNDAVFIPKTNR